MKLAHETADSAPKTTSRSARHDGRTAKRGAHDAMISSWNFTSKGRLVPFNGSLEAGSSWSWSAMAGFAVADVP